MSWNDALKGAVGSLMQEAEQAALPGLVKGVLGAEGLQTILAKLQAGGLGDQVRSWLDQNKSNLPVSADQIRAALGDEHVKQIATSLGIPMDQVTAALAKFLPAVASEAAAAAPPATGEPGTT